MRYICLDRPGEKLGWQVRTTANPICENRRGKEKNNNRKLRKRPQGRNSARALCARVMLQVFASCAPLQVFAMLQGFARLRKAPPGSPICSRVAGPCSAGLADTAFIGFRWVPQPTRKQYFSRYRESTISVLLTSTADGRLQELHI